MTASRVRTGIVDLSGAWVRAFGVSGAIDGCKGERQGLTQ